MTRGTYARHVVETSRGDHEHAVPSAGSRRPARRGPSILAAARATPARRRLRQPLHAARRRGRRRPAQPDPLPLRQQAAAHPRRPRGRERAAPRAAARDVRRPGAAVAAVGARLRLLRRGPGVRLRPGPPGDDRRGLVRPGGRRGRPRRSRAAGTACWPRSPTATRTGSAGSGRSRPAEVGALMGLPFLGAESAILLGFTEESCRASPAHGRRSARSAVVIRMLGGADPGMTAAARRRPATVPRARADRARATRTRPASSSATASGSPGSGTATGRRRSCCCRPGRSSIRATGRGRSPTSPATSGS